MKKIISLLILSMVCVFTIHAQTRQLTGKVVDQTNNPIALASVSVNGTFKTSTNDTGEFTIACSDSFTITITALGFTTYSNTVACNSEPLVIQLNLKNVSLDEIEVTASSNPNKSQLDQPSSIVKLSNTELNRTTGLFFDDAINTNVPGVMMERRSNSGGQQLNIRGYGNGVGPRGITGNFDIQGTKIYLNGIPVTDAEGITVLDDIDFNSVSNVEVSKGPSGTLYGLAPGGVVNLQTQQAASGQMYVAQNFTAGSYGLIRSTSTIAIGGSKSSILVNYGHQQFGGFTPHTKSHKDFVNVSTNFNNGSKQIFTTYFGFSDSYDERNGELSIGQYDTLDYSGNQGYIKNDAHSYVRTFRAGIGHTYLFTKNIANTTSVFGTAQSIDQSSGGGWTDKYPLNYGLRSVFTTKFDLGKKIILSGITGIEMQKMNAITLGYGMSADSTNLGGYNTITSLRSNQATINSTYHYFTQWTATFPFGISATAGVGVSNQNLRLEDRLWGLSNNHPDNLKQKVYEAKYNNLISPTFSVNKKIGQFASVYASYSVAYKAPVAANILISTTGQLNTELKPEKGTQIELGTKGSFFDNRLFYTIAVFNAQFTDKFTTVAVQNPANTVTLYSYLVNAGTLNNKGLEVLVKYNVMKNDKGFIKSLRPFANVAYSDFKYGDFNYQRIGKNVNNKDSLIIDNYTGKQVAGVAPLVFNAGVDIDTKIGLYGNVNFNYRSAMYFTSDGLNETDPYHLLNAKIGFKKSIAKFEFDIHAGANNITSTQYYQMVFVNQLPDAYIPAPNKINFYGGINLKYNFN
jgi:iron complex outermembrane receptor protein